MHASLFSFLPASICPTSSYFYSAHLPQALPFVLCRFQHVQLVCHAYARAHTRTHTHALTRPYKTSLCPLLLGTRSTGPILTALIGSDSKYVPWNWLGMRERKCVSTCAPHRGARSDDKGAGRRKTRVRDRDLEEEWRREASWGIESGNV